MLIHFHRKLEELECRILQAIHNHEEKVMAAIDDLKAAVTRLNTSTTAELQAIADKLLTSGNADDPDVEAAANSLNALADKIDAETASLAPPAPPVAG